MEQTEVGEVRSAGKPEDIGIEVDAIRYGEEIQALMSVPVVETGSSFTALLELPAIQAVKLLHSPEVDEKPASRSRDDFNCIPSFPSDVGFIDRAAKFSIFSENSMERSSIPVKQEPEDSDSQRISSPTVPDPLAKTTKRKEREKNVKGSAKKTKSVANENSKEKENLPYVHVRARRGQATDSHSLAERARREKINARMKLLQELVPGCDKISGTAMVLDEIIRHVQSLQRQVELLSMRLAAVNPRIDVNLDGLFAEDNGSFTDCSFPGLALPQMWPEGQLNGSSPHYQQLWQFDTVHQSVWDREDTNPNFITPENSLLSYDSSANSASLQINRLKTEL